MNTFSELGFQFVKNAISSDTAKLLSFEFNIIRNHECLRTGHTLDTNITNSRTIDNVFGWYCAFGFESLSLLIQPQIENIVGKKLYPVYSYARCYYNNSSMHRHTDREGSEFGVSLCIEKNIDWALGIRDVYGVEHLVEMDVGDLCVYKAMELEHWRSTFTGNRHTQAFIFYVDQIGKYSDLKYDTKPYLGFSLQDRKKVD